MGPGGVLRRETQGGVWALPWPDGDAATTVGASFGQRLYGGLMRYIPIMKWKQGEWQALGGLADDVRGAITPLMEMVPATEAANTPQDHVNRRVRPLAQRWTGEAFADVRLFAEYDGVEVREAFGWLHEASLATDLVFVPVTALWNRDYASDAVPMAREVGRLCLRLTRRDVLLPDLEARMEALLGAAELDPSVVDVVLDLESDLTPVDADSMLAQLPNLAGWRTVALAGGGFERPQGAGQALIPREHLALWRDLDGRIAERDVVLSDYGAIEPEYRHFTGYVLIVPQIVYTDAANWFVARGERVDVHGWEQTAGLARQVVERPEFAGAMFSEGDRWIAERADGSGTSGNSSKLVEVKTSHHLTQVVRNDLAIPLAS